MQVFDHLLTCSVTVVLVDFLHFIDAMIEAYGDAFYDLRYRCVMSDEFLLARGTPHDKAHWYDRYLFRLIDTQNDNSLQDEELVPILMAAGLDEAAAHAACARLLGGQLTVRPPRLACCILACL
jgi:hypothetical protein